MPNGGHPPSCIFCKWGTRMPKSRYSVGIDCQRHKISVELAVATFCPDLASPNGPGMEAFIARERIAPGSVYVWNDIDDRDKGYTALASIPTYQAWSADQVEEAIARVQNPTSGRE